MAAANDVPPSLESYVRGVIRAVGVQLLLITVLTGGAFGYLRWWLGPELEQAIRNARTVRILHEAMLDEETNLRAYLITGDDDLLQAIEAGRSTMDDANTSLASHHRFGADYAALRLAQQRWTDEWADVAIDGGRAAFQTEAELQAFIRSGRALFDDYRRIEESLITDLIAERDRLLALQQRILALASAIALVTGAALFLITLRERRRIDEIVVEPVADLRRAMEQISEGDFAARPRGGGTEEMRQLADSLDSMATQLHEALRTVAELSQTDALTALFNRRRLDTDLHAEVDRSQRHSHPLAFAMADLDRFKDFNDTHGHQRGDEVLQEVARVLSSSVRSSDTVYRYGGEELSILFRDTTLDEATTLAERLRATVEHHFTANDGQLGVTISIGVASLDETLTTPDDIIGAADAALYESKAGGRNRVSTLST